MPDPPPALGSVGRRGSSGGSRERVGCGGLYRSVSAWMSARAEGAEEENSITPCLGGDEGEESVGVVSEASSEEGGGKDSSGEEQSTAESMQDAAGTHLIDDGAVPPRPQLYTSLSTWLEAGDVKPPAPVKQVSVERLWAAARRKSRHAVLAQRWHKDVDRRWKQIWLDFKLSHTFLAAVFYRGSPGYTRAQTCQILLNSLALELVVLCMFYSSPSEGPVVINPIKIISAGCVAALVCMPAMILFSWCFTPIAFVRLARLILLLPYRLLLLFLLPCTRRNATRARTTIASSPSPPPSPPASPPSSTAAPSLPAPAQLPAPIPAHAVAIAMPAVAGTAAATAVPVAAVTTTTGLRGKWAAVAAQQQKQKQPDSPGRPRKGRHGDADEIKVSYASLDEHLLQLSLRHALKQRDFRCAASIAGTWLLAWAVFFGLMLTFSLYACEFSLQRVDATNKQELLLSWGWSIGQRFLLNEPGMILLSKGLPMLFTSPLFRRCGCWSDTCGELFAMTIDVLVQMIRSLKA